MNGPEKTNGPDPIREMIDAEERAAVARFRDSRFGERLKARLGERRTVSARPAAFGPAFRPVWVSLAVLAIAAAAALWLLQPFSRPLPGRLAIAAALHRSPGLYAIENPPRPLTGSPLLPASPFERGVTSVLSVPKAGDAAGTGGTRGYAAIDPASAPLGLRKVYEILVIDRSIERVLTDASSKTKEG